MSKPNVVLADKLLLIVIVLHKGRICVNTGLEPSLLYLLAERNRHFRACVRVQPAYLLFLLHIEEHRYNRKYNGGKCQTPHVTEEEIKALFIKAYNELISERKEIIANAEIIRKTLCTTDTMLAEKQQLEDEILVLVEMTQNLVAENARVAQDQEEYQKRYDSLVLRYETAKKNYDELAAKIEQKEARGERILQFIKILRKQDGIITEFDEALWGSMVEFVTIGKASRSVTFKDGTEIQVLSL